MRPWSARLLVGLYPASWRRLYGREFQAMLEDDSRGSRGVASIVVWAFYERLRSVARVRTALVGIGADILYVLRGWRKAPTFSATTILTLVLGIGISAAVFSFADGYLFRPLPFPSAGQLYFVSDPEASPALLRASDVSALKRSPTASFGFVEWNTSSRISGTLVVNERAVDVLAYEVSQGFRDTVPLPLVPFLDAGVRPGPRRCGASPSRPWSRCQRTAGGRGAGTRGRIVRSE
jgi:hypothetical protein